MVSSRMLIEMREPLRGFIAAFAEQRGLSRNDAARHVMLNSREFNDWLAAEIRIGLDAPATTTTVVADFWHCDEHDVDINAGAECPLCKEGM